VTDDAKGLGLAGPLGPVFYGFFRAVFALSYNTVWRRRVVGIENVPRAGGAILAANHASFADPPLVGSAVPRRVFFMAKQELFDAPFFGWVIKQLNAFPIRRVERDMGAFRMAQRILTSGECLIVFPEGTRQRDGNFGKARPGVGMLALKAGVPVVPIYVHNSRKLGSLAPLTVVFGEPLSPEGESDYQTFSNKVMAAIARLKETHFGTQQ
jgi:1-acyl-sn-glycerol-3-phosphate acyltransferase